MPGSVNELNITNFVQSGNTSIPRWTFSLNVKYTLEDGVLRTYGPATHTWPNDLTGIPTDVQQKMMREIITAKTRVSLGISDWDEYR